MIEGWDGYQIVWTEHILLKIQQRGISKSEIESNFKERKKLSLAVEGRQRGVWEAYFKRSHKYSLKVVVHANENSKELKLITAYVLNRKRVKAVQKW